MTDDERDELAAAYLDGECTSDERALVEADPDLLARVEAQRAVHEALTQPPTEVVDVRRRELALAAALAAFDEAPPTPAPAIAPARRAVPSDQLAPRRRRREQSRMRLVVGAGIAAAFVAVVGIASQADLGGDDDAADTAADVPAAETSPADEAITAEALSVDDDASAADAGAADGASTETTTAAAADTAEEDATAGAGEAATTQAATGPIVDLGAFSDPAALATAYSARSFEFDEPSAAVPSTVPVPPDCQATLADQGLTVVATASVAGSPVLLAVTDPFAAFPAVIVDAATCTVTTSVDLEG